MINSVNIVGTVVETPKLDYSELKGYKAFVAVKTCFKPNLDRNVKEMIHRIVAKDSKLSDYIATSRIGDNISVSGYLEQHIVPVIYAGHRYQYNDVYIVATQAIIFTDIDGTWKELIPDTEKNTIIRSRKEADTPFKMNY